MIYFLTILLPLATTYIGVEAFRRWSLRRGLLDVPNERSSHAEPTPRGGGLIIVIIAVISYIVVSAAFPSFYFWSFLVGGILVAVISWLDDLYSINVVLRFSVHSFAAILVVYEVGHFESLTTFFGNGVIDLSNLGPVITFLWIVWVINAYNFMDGIDGIAGGQAVVAAIGWIAIGFLGRNEAGVLFGMALAGASLGFLIHNWPPAKIFMGDIGSAFIGFVLAVLPFMMAKTSVIDPGILPWLAAAMIWPFVFDTVFTLFRRLIAREKVWRAHRSHIYQRMVIAGRSHLAVTSIYTTLAILTAVGAVVTFASQPLSVVPVAATTTAAAIILLIFRLRSSANTGAS